MKWALCSAALRFRTPKPAQTLTISAELIDCINALANYVCNVVPGIIGSNAGCTGSGIDEAAPYGVIGEMAMQVRGARAIVAQVQDELSRPAREFKL